jgi:hypothetical protein
MQNLDLAAIDIEVMPLPSSESSEDTSFNVRAREGSHFHIERRPEIFRGFVEKSG